MISEITDISCALPATAGQPGLSCFISRGFFDLSLLNGKRSGATGGQGACKDVVRWPQCSEA